MNEAEMIAHDLDLAERRLRGEALRVFRAFRKLGMMNWHAVYPEAYGYQKKQLLSEIRAALEGYCYEDSSSEGRRIKRNEVL